jgi:hypothetical protein
MKILTATMKSLIFILTKPLLSELRLMSSVKNSKKYLINIIVGLQ